MQTNGDESSSVVNWLKKIKPSDTILVALSPIFAYLFLFAYQAGYFTVYHIPLQLIEFGVGEIFVIVAGFFSVAYVLLGLSNFFATVFYNIELPQPIARRLKFGIPFYILFFVNLILFKKIWEEWLLFLVVIAILTANDFLFPLIFQKEKVGYIEKLHLTDISNQKSDDQITTIPEQVIKVIGRGIFLLFLYFVLSLYLVYQAGRASAMQQEVFYAVNTNPEMVVLYMTKDRAVCSPFDRTNKTIQPKYTVIEIGKDISVEFSLVNIGPLTLGTTPTISLPSSTPTIIVNSTVTPVLPTLTPNTINTPQPAAATPIPAITNTPILLTP